MGNLTPFDGITNARDLGGLSTLGGLRTLSSVLYRSGALDRMSERDRHRLVNEMRVGTVVDIRTREESDGDGLQDQRLLPEVRCVHVSVVPEGRIGREPFPDGRDPIALAEGYFANLVEGAEALAEIIAIIAGAVSVGESVLFHCAAGRDRTGLVAALLLGLVEVTDEHIISDYIASNSHALTIAERLRANPLYVAQSADGIKPVMLRNLTMIHFLGLVGDRFGGVDGWASRVGVSDEAVSGLRRSLVPGQAAQSP
ncbi:protein tyrosine/serine phosphatase [Parafrankia sp. EUN1f]|nr:protein tyrosine/serine phosphatase [Parafrankia sp. EUN1f]